MLIWSIAFNLMQLFFYRRLKKPRFGRKATDTIQAVVNGFWTSPGSLVEPVPWADLLDTA